MISHGYFSPRVILFILMLGLQVVSNISDDKKAFSRNPKYVCIRKEMSVTGRQKSCFLRPDTGPCRADIVQYYYDVRLSKCFMFFWGGCQGNGNRFDTRKQCMDYCYLNYTMIKKKMSSVPYFCSVAFDFGNCFGHYYRWGYDHLAKSCKRHIYSGCGGNQNNFQTKQECMSTCIETPPHESIANKGVTTCIPFNVVEIIS